MKPSEYLINRKLISVGNFINPYKINYKLNKFDNTIKSNYIKELDRRFIDREELKEEINQRINDINNCLGELSYTKKYKQIQEERIVLLKEVLELLK